MTTNPPQIRLARQGADGRPARAALLHDLGRIDRLIRRAVDRLRAELPQPPDQFQGMYISDAEVDAILDGDYPLRPGFGAPHDADPLPELAQPWSPRVQLLAERCGLDDFALAVVLIALAPEIDLAYERLYGYLHDDTTRRRPTVDLALNLLCPTAAARLEARTSFAANSPLVGGQIVQLAADPGDHAPPLLRHALLLDERITRFLLGDDALDAHLAPFVRLARPSPGIDDLLLPMDLRLTLGKLADTKGVLIYLQGPYGVGKRAIAGAIAQARGGDLLLVDGERLAAGAGFERLLRLTLREATLQGTAIFWGGLDPLLADDRAAECELLLRALAARPTPAFLGGETTWEPAGELAELPFIRLELELPTATERAILWERALGEDWDSSGKPGLGELANAFRLTGGQIRDAAATARNLACRRDPARPQIKAADLNAASRLHSNRRLAELARRITPRYSWDDIVLPEDRLAQLRELCATVRYHSLVYDDWGFGRRLALGKGVNALFAGPSGTGKTLAAEIIAGELGLDLYTIDLATVVSKYIGETEKNLARIFAEAETSNAVLFFDEADAIFGKRSEVRDAHDRYANIEIAYLLQRIEAYSGIVILATNLRKNIDEAFVRRLQHIVEFPFPAESERRRLWEVIWPAQTPRDPTLDLGALARRFELAGGNIRNIALTATFLAAADGQLVTLPHLLQATRREYQKLGKVADEDEFVL